MRVLVVEDDDNLRFAVAAALRADGLAVDEVADLPAADEALFITGYDCAVFDRMLPSGDSLDYVQDLRLTGRTVPVLFLTARDQVEDRVAGFAAGGDDYLVKPFALPELTARVRSLCRRAGTVRPPVHRLADLEIDTARRQVRRGGVLLILTRKEFAVLEILAARADHAVPRAELIEKCWDEMAEPNSNVVDVLMSQLRRKLGDPPLIHTVRGVGYRLTSDGAGC
ncbi:response regulator transcription factor [Streptomyces natalensis]|uniref:Transcriptional regulator n=1 Tax=Streptomyces natalensis ATCC 27448 TaxID=1240678 RepID=A0A0D7CTT2_9ACTN|nr:response regulator transcription factor [Streptomyces natalensis]KIZ19648.1 transcriptional regulator [Streptomyces natalensis ATCC 27448]